MKLLVITLISIASGLIALAFISGGELDGHPDARRKHPSVGKTAARHPASEEMEAPLRKSAGNPSHPSFSGEGDVPRNTGEAGGSEERRPLDTDSTRRLRIKLWKFAGRAGMPEWQRDDLTETTPVEAGAIQRAVQGLLGNRQELARIKHDLVLEEVRRRNESGNYTSSKVYGAGAGTHRAMGIFSGSDGASDKRFFTIKAGELPAADNLQEQVQVLERVIARNAWRALVRHRAGNATSQSRR